MSYKFYAKSMDVPEEIMKFLFEIFCIIEQRGTVGKVNGLKFEIRTKEQGHNVPHVHASYGEYQMSIAIENGIILAGYLPNKQIKIAKEWIETNKEMLFNEWKTVIVDCDLPYTGTMLPNSMLVGAKYGN